MDNWWSETDNKAIASLKTRIMDALWQTEKDMSARQLLVKFSGEGCINIMIAVFALLQENSVFVMDHRLYINVVKLDK